MHNVSAQASHQRNEDDFRMETQVQELTVIVFWKFFENLLEIALNKGNVNEKSIENFGSARLQVSSLFKTHLKKHSIEIG